MLGLGFPGTFSPTVVFGGELVVFVQGGDVRWDHALRVRRANIWKIAKMRSLSFRKTAIPFSYLYKVLLPAVNSNVCWYKKKKKSLDLCILEFWGIFDNSTLKIYLKGQWENKEVGKVKLEYAIVICHITREVDANFALACQWDFTLTLALAAAMV